LTFLQEHQREDRDSYVHFDCSKLKGYAEARTEVEKHGRKHTVGEVCKTYWIADLYFFDPIQSFDTIDHLEVKDGKQYPLFIVPDDEFDDESVRLYSLGEFMNPDGDPNDVMHLQLSYWKKRGTGYVGPSQPTKDDLELIPVNWKVSSGDYEGVCHFYPYQEGGT
jgi:hypothetical protein